jgi:hypothetical protein
VFARSETELANVLRLTRLSGHEADGLCGEVVDI